MDDAGAMRFVERSGNLHGVLERTDDRERSSRETNRQRLALDVLHHQEIDPLVMSDVVQRADVRVVQRRHGARLAFEALACVDIARDVGGQHLDRDGAIETGVARFVHVAHAAGADVRDECVRSDMAASEVFVCRGRVERHAAGGRLEKPAGAIVRGEQLLDLFAQRRVLAAGRSEMLLPRLGRKRDYRFEQLAHARPIFGSHWHGSVPAILVRGRKGTTSGLGRSFRGRRRDAG
jgi:hypothetical protein